MRFASRPLQALVRVLTNAFVEAADAFPFQCFVETIDKTRIYRVVYRLSL